MFSRYTFSQGRVLKYTFSVCSLCLHVHTISTDFNGYGFNDMNFMSAQVAFIENIQCCVIHVCCCTSQYPFNKTAAAYFIGYSVEPDFTSLYTTVFHSSQFNLVAELWIFHSLILDVFWFRWFGS